MFTKQTEKQLLEKWTPLIEDEALPKINTHAKRVITAQLLENTEQAYESGHIENVSHPLMEAAPTTNTSGVQNYDPVLISLLRRSAPKLIAHDILGVQPMSGPNGTIFALRPRYDSMTGDEAWYVESNTGHSSIRGGTTALGDAIGNVGTVPSGNTSTFNYAAGMTTAQAEALGTQGNSDFREMSFSIEKITVTAESRALKATYTHELAQDLKAIHGLDAHKELSNILSTELISEMNRQIVRAVFASAVSGTPDLTTPGVIDMDVDTNGRWAAEKWVGLHFILETEMNAIAKATRRGKGNILITSSNVASALVAAKLLDQKDAVGLQIDDTGNTFAGTLGGRTRVYIDPYATADFAVCGYKGASEWDAGIYWAPYTPIQQVRTVHPGSLSPIIGFKTRAGIVANPFSKGATPSNGVLEANTNVYYRRNIITNLI